jgi:hypothetical protein
LIALDHVFFSWNRVEVSKRSFFSAWSNLPLQSPSSAYSRTLSRLLQFLLQVPRFKLQFCQYSSRQPLWFQSSMASFNNEAISIFLCQTSFLHHAIFPSKSMKDEKWFIPAKSEFFSPNFLSIISASPILKINHFWPRYPNEDLLFSAAPDLLQVILFWLSFFLIQSSFRSRSITIIFNLMSIAIIPMPTVIISLHLLRWHS